MRNALKVLLLLLLVATVSSCSSSKKLVLRIEEKPKPTQAPLAPPVKVRYVADVGDVGYKAVLFARNGRLYIGNLDGRIYAVDPIKGSKKLVARLKKPIEAGVLVTQKTLYAATTGGVLYKLSLKNGKVLAKRQLAFPVMERIYMHGARLYVITEDDTVTCMDPKTLKVLWSYSNGLPGTMDIRSTAGLLFLPDGICTGFSDGSVAKISYKGDLLFSVQVGKGSMFIDSDATPKGSNRIFVTSVNGYTQAISAKDGSLVWRREISSYSNLQENIFGLFLADETGDVMALDNDNGETIWKKKLTLKGNIFAIKLVGNFLYAITQDGTLVVLDALKGKIMDIKHNIDSDFSSHILLYNNRLYLISRDGDIYEISSKQ